MKILFSALALILNLYSTPLYAQEDLGLAAAADLDAPKRAMIFVANYKDNTVSLIINGVKTKDIHVGKNPCAFVNHKNILYVANEGDGTVSVITNGVKTKDIHVGKNPCAFATHKNTLYVANKGDGTISRITDGVKRPQDIQVGLMPKGINYTT